jgi:hypothetical protein
MTGLQPQPTEHVDQAAASILELEVSPEASTRRASPALCRYDTCMSYRAAYDETLQKLMGNLFEVDTYESALAFNAHAAISIRVEAFSALMRAFGLVPAPNRSPEGTRPR